MNPTAAWIVIGFALLDCAQGLLCRQCFSLSGWDECERTARDNLCTTVGVNTAHLNLLHENPTLALGNHSQFRCFKYQARLSRHNDKGLVDVYGRGCTFVRADFCSGWKPSVAVKQCDLCDDRNLCNAGLASWPSTIAVVCLTVISLTNILLQ